MKRLLPMLVLCSGCAFGPGEPFATITPAMDVKLDVPSGRAADNGFYKLSSNYQVKFSKFDVEYTEAHLIDLGDTAASGFDPAHPPAGYTICHNGHCDREDGALVSYEEVAAELSGGGSTGTDVVHLTVGEVNVLDPRVLSLECEGSCELPASSTDLVKLGVKRLQVEGVFKLPPSTVESPFVIDFTLPEEAELTAREGIDVTRHSSTKVALTLRPRLGPAVLDGIDFNASLSNDEAKAQLTENLVTTPLDVDVER